MPVYRLGSNGLVHVPGIMARAINSYAFPKDRTALRHVIVDGWPGIPDDAPHLLFATGD
jgi:hypothetical protein